MGVRRGDTSDLSPLSGQFYIVPVASLIRPRGEQSWLDMKKSHMVIRQSLFMLGCSLVISV